MLLSVVKCSLYCFQLQLIYLFQHATGLQFPPLNSFQTITLISIIDSGCLWEKIIVILNSRNFYLAHYLLLLRTKLLF